MSTSSALVVSPSPAPAPPEEDAELPMDLSQLPAIPATNSLLLINNFVANTTRFLNHFAHECEERVTRVSDTVTRVEILLAILEAKLNSIPDLTVTDAEVAAAASDDIRKLNSNQMDLGISDQDLPSMDSVAAAAAANDMPLPLPPPPDEHVDVEVDGMALPPPPPSMDGLDMALTVPRPPSSPGALSVIDALPPPPPPPPSLGDFGTPDATEMQSDGPSMLKLKDDPVYAKYFTMRRLGIPDSVIEHKLLMDGMGTDVLTMDPDGPSPSGALAPTHSAEPSGPILPIMAPPLPPPPPSAESEAADSSDVDEDDDGMTESVRSPPPPPPAPPSLVKQPQQTDQVPSGNIGLPFPPRLPPSSPTQSAERSSTLLGGALPAPPPPLPSPENALEGSSDDDIEEFDADDRASGAGDAGVMKVKDDPAFEKYFKMRKLGMPDSVIQHKLMMDGVTADILNMDPEGPSPNATSAGSTVSMATVRDGADLPLPPILPPPLPPGGLPPPPAGRYDDSDSDFDSD